MQVSVALLCLLAVAIGNIEQAWAIGGDDGFDICLDDDDCTMFGMPLFHTCGEEIMCESKCFSGNNVVTTKAGDKLIKDLGHDDHVLSVDSDGAVRYQPVLLDIHHHPGLMSEFVRVATEDGGEITLSAKHYLYVTDNAGVSSLKTADEVIPGSDSLVSQRGDGLALSKVSAVESGVRSRGLYNPLVASGRMLVGGVLASVYSDDIPPITPKVAHTLLWPVRQMCAALPVGGYAHPVSGMPYWAHYANLIRSSVF